MNHRPTIEANGVYPREVVEEILSLSKTSLTSWINHGLAYVKAPDSCQMFFGKDILEFLEKCRQRK